MNLLFILQANAGGNALYSNLLFMGLMFAIAYFFLIRPQTKRTKDQKNFMDALSKGDEVVTNGGIVGKISKMDDDTVTIHTTEKTFIRVTKSSVNRELSHNYTKEEASA